MASYSINTIAEAMSGQVIQPADISISNICIDSRKIVFPERSLFFALRTNNRDGHFFARSAYEKGVRAFVISDDSVEKLSGAVYIKVNDTLKALQQLSAWHRKQFNYPVIGITGSNGKTIVKEWLYSLLKDSQHIIRSPKSYNSQIGVPLSVWPMSTQYDLAIIEAGISEKGEMKKLEEIIHPTIGIFTNIGDAHAEGFASKEEKIKEKLQLFIHADTLIYCSDQQLLNETIAAYLLPLNRNIKLISWGRNDKADIRITATTRENTFSSIQLKFRDESISFKVPFSNDASIENAMHCIAVALTLNIDKTKIQKALDELSAVAMRLELKKGTNNCSIINDSYSSDIHSLEIALDFLLQQRQHPRRSIILSDIVQSGMNDEQLYTMVARLLHEKKVNRLVAVGEHLSLHRKVFESYPGLESHFYSSVESLEKDIAKLHFRDESILIKGARVFELEQIEKILEQKVHQTVLEINLSAVAHNLAEYKKLLKPTTKMMVMVKAFGYGSGTYEIANLLQFHQCDYLAVAYADEGVELRRSGITLPIMVMNPEETAFDLLVDHNLEPELFSFDIFKKFESFIRSEGLQDFPVHIKLDTGMHRLGFMQNEIEDLCFILKQNNSFKIQSVFSHLAASEDKQQDAFTQQQDYLFMQACNRIYQAVQYPFLKHIANSAAVFRHPAMQYDMIRLGIGLYGVDSAASEKIDLKQVMTLKTTIAQIKELSKSETVGYGRKGELKKNSTIAIVRIGYADGYSRRFSNGAGNMLVNGKLAPVTGIVAMDMTMIDITDIKDVHEGDEVIIFGKDLPIERLAKWADTIPYEIMTSVSQRVKRVYYEE